MFTGMKSRLPRKYATMMHSAPSSHLSSWTCLAGCEYVDPGPPVSGAAPLNVCVHLPWTTTPSYAAVCQCQPSPNPQETFARSPRRRRLDSPHHRHLQAGLLGIEGFPWNVVVRREGTLG